MPAITATEIVAHLRELGLVAALIGAPAPEGAGAPISAVATDAEAAPGDLAWSRRPGAAARFRGSLLICSAEAAARARPSPPQPRRP